MTARQKFKIYSKFYDYLRIISKKINQKKLKWELRLQTIIAVFFMILNKSFVLLYNKSKLKNNNLGG